MITIQLLEDTDEVLPDYYCRPLIAYDAEINSFSAFGGKPQNHFKWIKVRDVLGEAWWGKPLYMIREVTSTDNNSIFPYEVVKGNIPREHILWYK